MSPRRFAAGIGTGWLPCGLIAELVDLPNLGTAGLSMEPMQRKVSLEERV